jgi:hypothetical protein
MNKRLAAAAFASLAVLASLVVAGEGAKPARHPHFDDQGALSWSTKVAAAQAAAKSQDKLIFVEYGREA